MTATMTKRETVLDWLPPEIHGALGQLLNRDQLIEHLGRRHVKVNTGNIRSWEHSGVLPLGIRRWRDGATRTLYPAASVYAILKLKELQALGLTLDEARPEVRGQFIALAIEQARIDPEEKLRLLSNVDLRLPPHVIQTLASFANFHESVSASAIVRMRIELIDENEKTYVYQLQKIDDDISAVWKVDPIHG